MGKVFHLRRSMYHFLLSFHRRDELGKLRIYETFWHQMIGVIEEDENLISFVMNHVIYYLIYFEEYNIKFLHCFAFLHRFV